MAHTFEHVHQLIRALSEISDEVRLVDPIHHKTITFAEDGSIEYGEYACYKIWEKQQYCQNCISLQAIKQNHRVTKFEFVDEDIYHVMAKPLEIHDGNGAVFNCVLETVNAITDEIFFEAFGKKKVIKQIIASEKKLYTDSLTSVFSRRYFDERVFCNGEQGKLAGKVIFIMADLTEFKQINDAYGHGVGDWVLTRTAQAIKACVRENDFVIRLGGDEFLIILTNCRPDIAPAIIENMKKHIEKEVIYDRPRSLHAKVNFGVSYEDEFQNNQQFIANMLRRADAEMYKDKKKQWR
jgi:diguanylate cyclase (GGDEF)-like protein